MQPRSRWRPRPVALAPPAAAAADPATQLADRYAPVVRVVAQEKECGTASPYTPIDVNAVLRNPDVALQGGRGGRSSRSARPESDLGKGLWLPPDFPKRTRPGLRLRSGRVRWRAQKPTSYARVVTDPDHPQQLALQYWFFYAFNGWNNTTRATGRVRSTSAPPTPRRQRTDPYGWVTASTRAASGRPGALEAEAPRRHPPVVYSALGSHANYFSSQLFLGRSGPRASAATAPSARRATSAS